MTILIDVLGWGGTIAIVGAYFLVSRGALSAQSQAYQLLNLYGSIALGFSVFSKGAWAAVALEVVWSIIALTALIGIWSKARPRT